MNDQKASVEKLYAQRSVSGFCEDTLLSYIKSELSDCCDEIFCDSIGNITALKRGSGGGKRKIALSAPIDEAGFVVTYVEESGKVRLHGIGSQPYSRLCGKTACSVSGVCGILLSDVSENIGADDLYFCTGAESAEETGLCEGDVVFIIDPPVFLGKNKISLSGLSEKIFCTSLIDIAKCSGDFSFDTYFIFTAQHILGTRGEKCAAYNISPDILIAFELCGSEKLKTGEGPAVLFADAGGRCSRSVTEGLCEASESIGVSVQKCADAAKDRPSSIAPYIAAGTSVGIIGAPCEKMSEGINLCDMRDIRGAAAVACAYLIFEDEKEENTDE